MSGSVISMALARQTARPDIHKKVKRPSRGESYGQDAIDMVMDLKEHLPSLSLRQLSTLVGVGCKGVRGILDSSVPAERWTEEDNPASCKAELTALRLSHPGREYEDETDRLGSVRNPDPDEAVNNRQLVFAAPAFRDPYRRADQSHTVKRPITLATRPFDVAA